MKPGVCDYLLPVIGVAVPVITGETTRGLIGLSANSTETNYLTAEHLDRNNEAAGGVRNERRNVFDAVQSELLKKRN